MKANRMRCWRIKRPNSGSDYTDTWVNGGLSHELGVPGIECDVCGEIWTRNQILPYPAPKKMLKDKRLRGGVLPRGEHDALRAEIVAALRAEGVDVDDVSIGADFQPGRLTIPTRPTADFLWCSIGSLVVSERIRTALIDASATGCTFAPVVIEKIGRKPPTVPAPIPSSGEPEDLEKHARRPKPGDVLPEYYEMIVTAKSGPLPGMAATGTCRGCGRQEGDLSARRFVMRDDMWRGDDVFHLATTLWVVVTDRVADLLKRLSPTNVLFEEMPSER